MIKDLKPWRFVAALMIGFAIGVITTTKVLTNELAKRHEAGQSINIGRLKIKNSSDIDLPINQEDNSKKEETKKRRRWQK